MRITSKGQVTIPKPIRDRAGLLPGTDVEFAIEDEKVTVRRSDRVSRRGADLIAHLRAHRGEFTMTTEEIMALTRGESAP